MSRVPAGAAASSDFPDFQLGFRSCLTNVHQYLLVADKLPGGERWALEQLSHRLWRCRRGRRWGEEEEEARSTTDSGPDAADAQNQSAEVAQNGAEEEQQVPCEARALHTAPAAPCAHSEDARQSSDTKQAQSSAHRNSECSEAELSVWRPW